jgi:hypothetical protein
VQQVRFGDDADDVPFAVHDGERAHAVGDEQLGDVLERGIAVDRRHLCGYAEVFRPLPTTAREDSKPVMCSPPIVGCAE